MMTFQDGTGRRAADIAAAIGGLAAASIPMLVLGVAIRATSPGPAIFRQTRIGRYGEEFTIYKFRSMHVGSDGPSVSGKTDARITTIGKWMRARRLDELPQLFNLLLGEMTLIGPRPEVPRFVDNYTDEERTTLNVRPGIIGAGAVLFATDQASDLDASDDPDRYYVKHQLHPKLALDLEYLRSRGLKRDVLLLLSALGIAGRGAK